MKKALKFINALLFLAAFGVSFIELVRLAVVNASLIDLIKLGFGKAGGSAYVRELVDMVQESVKPLAMAALVIVVLMWLGAILSAVLRKNSPYICGLILAVIQAAGVTGIYFGIDSKLDIFRQGLDFFGLGSKVKMYSYTLVIWLVIYVVIILISIVGIALKDKSAAAERGPIMEEQFHTGKNPWAKQKKVPGMTVEQDYLAKIQELEMEQKRQKQQNVSAPSHAKPAAQNAGKPAGNVPVSQNAGKPAGNVPVSQNAGKPAGNVPTSQNVGKPIGNVPVSQNVVKQAKGVSIFQNAGKQAKGVPTPQKAGKQAEGVPVPQNTGKQAEALQSFGKLSETAGQAQENEEGGFNGAIVGLTGEYASKAYMLGKKQRVFFEVSEGKVVISELSPEQAVASVYFVGEYKEYCVDVMEPRSFFLKSGQPLGKGRTYYLPRGTEIYLKDKKNRFTLA